jgi:hypothetical protein
MLDGQVVPTIENWINRQIGKSVCQANGAVLRTPICWTDYSKKVLFYQCNLILKVDGLDCPGLEFSLGVRMPNGFVSTEDTVICVACFHCIL